MNRFFIGLLITFLIASCKSDRIIKIDNSEINLNLLENYLTKLNANDISKCFIIPSSGCNSCIELTYEYLLKNNEDVLYILTRLDDKKILKNKLGIDEASIPNNIILDYKNALLDIGYTSIYPVILFVANGRITKIEVIKPDNIKIFDTLQ